VFFEVCESMSEQYLSPEVYIAEITDAKLVGATSLLIAGNKFLNDMVYYDDEERIDIRYQAVKKVINKIAIVEQVKYKKKFDTAINLIAVASFNYYHLLFETLSKLTFVDAISEYREIPILVDEVVMRIPQYRAALQSINKYQHPICVLGKEEGCIVERLIHPSSNVWMPINVYHRSLIKPSDFIVSDKVIKNLRDSVELCDHRKPWRKIFISRKNTQAIRLKNEAEVKELFTKNGFETVFTEELSFQQQIQIFGQASVVIATSGAALTNILFCQPGTIIGCIIPETHKFYMYSTIAYLLHMRAIFINAEVVERTLYPAADTFEVDLDYAKRYLQWINAEVFEKGA
jgi:capsular polysaccharide biosynthesis protein